MATYAGQNVGAGKLDRVTKGLKACSFIGLVYSIIACVILFVFGKQFTLLFIDGKASSIFHLHLSTSSVLQYKDWDLANLPL